MASVTIGTIDGIGTLNATSISIGASGSTAIVAGTTGKVARIYRIWLAATGSNTIKFQDGTTDLSGVVQLAAGTPFVLNNTGLPWFVSSAGNAININATGTAQVSGVVYWTQS